jgi:hypothetical protein
MVKASRTIEKNDWQTILETAAARRVIWEVMEIAGTFGSSYDDNPYRMAFNEGKRAIGQHIYAEMMAHCPERFLQAQNEMNSRLKQIEIKNKQAQEKQNGEDNVG